MGGRRASSATVNSNNLHLNRCDSDETTCTRWLTSQSGPQTPGSRAIVLSGRGGGPTRGSVSPPSSSDLCATRCSALTRGWSAGRGINGEEDIVFASLRPGGSIIRCNLGPLENNRMKLGTQMGSPKSKNTRWPTMGPHQMDENGLKIIQLNMNKSRGCMMELRRQQFDIGLVQEPNLTRGRMNLIPPTHRSFYKGKARAAVIINNSLDYWPVESLSSTDLAVVALETSSGVNLFCSAYLDILKDPVMEELDKLIDYCNARKIALTIGMDANAHSTMWGCPNSNRRGEALEDWFLTKELYVHNVGSIPTFVPAREVTQTIIDLTVTNYWALQNIGGWRVVEEDMLSDHRMITFTGNNRRNDELEVFNRSFRKAKWEDFKTALGRLELNIAAEDDELPQVENVAEKIIGNIQEALDLVVPKTKRRVTKVDSWWTTEMAQKRREIKKRSRRRFKDRQAIEIISKLRREYSELIRKAKTNSWRDFVTRAKTAKEVSKIVQILENPPTKRMSLLKNEDNVLTPAGSLDYLLSTHFPDGVLRGEANDLDNSTEVDFTGVCQYMTSGKIRAALESFGDYKSPGPDEIPPIALKHLDLAHLEAICLLFQLSVATGQIPTAWREMKVTFIPKVGKSDYAVAKAYRPITLSNFLLKGLERVVQWYLLEGIMREPLYRQHAYTKGRSCDSALSTFINEVEYAIYNGKYLLAVSLDCSGAFDCIRFEAAEECMRSKGIPNNIIRWYMNLLKGRTVQAEIQGQKTHIVPRRGSPQGGVLSPLIWNLIMDSLLTTFKGEAVKVLGYADDILVYIIGKSPSVMAEMIEKSLDRVIEWGRVNGLSFNPSKTSMVLFTRNRRPIDISVRLDGTALELKDSFKYLGIEIHKSLSWTKHIIERSNKCKFLLTKCRSLIGRRWGLSPSKMDWIHKAVIRPKISYGAVVWAHKLTKEAEKRLDKVQRLAMLPITQPLRSTPTAGMEALLGWLPLSLYTQEVGMNTYIRNRHLVKAGWDGIGKLKSIGGHLGLWQERENSNAELTLPREKRLSEHIWKPELELDMAANHQIPGYEHPLVMYTDASKEGENIGYYWMASLGDYVIDESMISGKDISIYRAELLAIKEALEWLQDNREIRRPIVIYSDSKSAVAILNGYKATDEITRDTLTLLRDIGKDTKIRIEWVKGHSGVVGNEYADLRAKSAATEAERLAVVKPYMPITYKETKKNVHAHFIKVWQNRWEASRECRISKLFYPKVRESKKVLQMSLKELQQLTHMVTGHALFKWHLGHWNEIDDLQCGLCGEAQEDTWHLWEWCPRLALLRRNIHSMIESGLSFEKGVLKMINSKEVINLQAENEALIL